VNACIFGIPAAELRGAGGGRSCVQLSCGSCSAPRDHDLKVFSVNRRSAIAGTIEFGHEREKITRQGGRYSHRERQTL
jgi:hypothetical protein